MQVLGFLGSPRVNGICNRLLQASLEGAQSRGATVRRYDLIKLDIRHCLGCCKCLFDDPELPIGRCPIKDDMRSILEEYIKADGYIFASPVYDGSITSLMKKFIERKFSLTYRSPDAPATIGAARIPAQFKKKAVMVVTGNCPDEYQEVMGDPCFEQMSADWIVEQVDTVAQLYVGGVETLNTGDEAKKIESAFAMGRQMVDKIRQTSTGS